MWWWWWVNLCIFVLFFNLYWGGGGPITGDHWVVYIRAGCTFPGCAMMGSQTQQMVRVGGGPVTAPQTVGGLCVREQEAWSFGEMDPQESLVVQLSSFEYVWISGNHKWCIPRGNIPENLYVEGTVWLSYIDDLHAIYRRNNPSQFWVTL